MASSIFSMFSSVSLLILIGTSMSPGSKSGNMAMAVEDEASMALLPFGSASDTGRFFSLPQCRGPRRIGRVLSPPQCFNANASNLMHEMLDVHNAARAKVNVEPIQWDENVANYSRQYANNYCRMVHSGGPYGENTAQGIPDLTGIDAVKLWLDEKRFYYYDTNSCSTNMVCGHYTQVVWRNSVRLGCARVCCRGGALVICNYDPPGNVMGQRPY